MTEQEIRAVLEDIELLDAEVQAHGFCSNLRDYRVDIVATLSAPKATLSFVFVECVAADYKVAPGAIEGFNWAGEVSLYPGFTLLEPIALIASIAEETGKAFHVAEFETNVFKMNLVFRDLQVLRSGN